MLLVIDIGNTNLTFGLFCGNKLVRTWRLETSKTAPTNLRRVLVRAGRATHVEGVCIGSVVPRLNVMVKRAVRNAFGCTPLFATVDNCGVPVRGRHRKTVGVDRVIDLLAVHAMYRRACIVVDFGTATTFDVVNVRGEFLGGAIAPGLHLMNESLHRATALLPRVAIKRTRRVLATSTVANMQAGVFHGYVGLTDHLVRCLRKEVGGKPLVIATGGLAPLIAPASMTIRYVVPDLTLQGLRLVWERNA